MATQLYGVPLLLQPEKAEIIEAVFRAHVVGGELPDVSAHAPQPMAAAYAAPRFADKPYVVTESGVAVLPITGTLVHRGSGMDALSGLQSYTSLERQIDMAAADPDVRGIFLEIDSPGGQAAGSFALGEKLRTVDKPKVAHVNEMALSGGYLLAAAADKIVMAPTGRVGSIGVIALHQDRSKANAKAGIHYTAIYAGAKKADGSPHAPLTDSAKQAMQENVNSLYEHFVSYVAQMRGIDQADVRAQEAGIFSGQMALDNGLADEIKGFNEALAAFEQECSTGVGLCNGGAFRKHPKGAAMSNEAQTAAVESLTAEQVAEQVSAAKLDSAKAMQARIQSIQMCDEAKGREEMAAHLAFNTDMDADAAKALLAAAPMKAAAPVAQGNALAAGMAAVSNPDVGADAPAADLQANSAASLWNRSNAKLRAVK
jgi:capsid assembly protease